jgi:hypothetical protein
MATPHPSSSSSGTDDQVAKLLARAKALREEAALLSSKTIAEMEDERRRAKEIEREGLGGGDANATNGGRDVSGASRNGGGGRGGAAIPAVPEDAASQVRQAIERAYKIKPWAGRINLDLRPPALYCNNK